MKKLILLSLLFVTLSLRADEPPVQIDRVYLAAHASPGETLFVTRLFSDGSEVSEKTHETSQVTATNTVFLQPGTWAAYISTGGAYEFAGTRTAPQYDFVYVRGYYPVHLYVVFVRIE